MSSNSKIASSMLRNPLDVRVGVENAPDPHNPGSSDIVLLCIVRFLACATMADPFVGGTQLGPLTSLVAVCSSPRNLLTDGRPPRSSRSPCSAPILRDACGVARAEDAIGGKPSLSPSCRRPGHFSNSCAASLAGVAPSLRSLSRVASTRPPPPDLPNAPPFVVSEFLLASFTGEINERALNEFCLLGDSPNVLALLLTFIDAVRRAVAPSIDRNDRARRTPPPPFVSRPSRRRPSSSAASSPGRSSAIPNLSSVASTFALPSSSVGTAGPSRELDAASSRAGALDAHPMASPSSASPNDDDG